MSSPARTDQTPEPDAPTGLLTVLGDADAALCEGDACLLPPLSSTQPGKLDGSNLARVALLTGLTAEQINAVGGVRED
ncbi:hypothetical protein GCM10009555_075110 [Acrocarpospora macrocephala]|uniref:Uncharacterized protein n=1 Tax=Acrocarpospora macrocephala TaxID=150177 RepID=A0A5M3X1G0_9ACTN|nr:hypothetical protein [Acrocarpospora macrocephala]GES14472.1 hypothetical protein Amac_080690 [Acrocarpospora macrocephala]